MNSDNELIAKILTAYNHVNNTDLEPNESVELEFRLGTINHNGKYIPGVDPKQFSTLEKATSLFDVKSKKQENTLVLGSNVTYTKVLRNVVNLDTKTSYYEEKDKLDTVILPHHQMKFAIAKETILKAGTAPTLYPSIARFRNRTTYATLDKQWDISFTKTLSLTEREQLHSSFIKEWLKKIKTGSEDGKFKYEVEIEYTGEKQDNKKIYLSALSLLNDISHIFLGNNAANTVESDLIVEKIQGMLSDEFSYNRLLIGVKNISMSTLLPKVFSLTRHILGANKDIYSVTYKADGYRMLLYIPPDSECLMINYKKNIISTGIVISEPWKGNTVIDGEYMEESNTFLAFDIMIDKSKDVTNQSYLDRYQLLLNFDSAFTNEDKTLGMEFKIKPAFIRGRDIGEGLKYPTIFDANAEMLNYISKEKIKFDGLIFYPPGGYRGDVPMKWKPNDMRTIDMRLLLSKDDMTKAKIGSRVTGMALVTIRRADYMENRRWMVIPPRYLAGAPENLTSQWNFEIPFMQNGNLDLYEVSFEVTNIDNDKIYTNTENGTEIQLINTHIYEFYYKGIIKEGTGSGKQEEKPEGPCFQWCISRSRNDEKEWPNSFKAAADVWNTITNPITEPMIRGDEELPATYFIENASSMRSPIKEQKAMHLYVKDLTYKLAKDFQEKLEDTEPILLELGVGRGGSLHSWARNGWKTIVGIDMDTPALEEAHRRFLETKESGKYDMKESTLTTLSGDMSKADSWIGDSPIEFGKELFSAVSCQFAIMYATKDYESLNQFVDIVDRNLKRGGTFICTTMSGQAVVDLFNNNDIKVDEKYVWVKNTPNGDSEDVYSLMKKFDSDKLQDVGQKISSYVQTIGTHTEWLTNVDYIVGEFTKRGYKIALNQSFEVTIDEWKNEVQKRRSKMPVLSEAELDWISLQQVFVLEKGEPVDKPKQRKRRTKGGSAAPTPTDEPKIPKKRGRPKGKKSAKKELPTE